MAQLDATKNQEANAFTRLIAWLGRVIVALIIPLLAFVVIYYGFIFLRDTSAPRWVMAAVAIVWGVGGIALLYWVFNVIVERLPDQWRLRLTPFVFVGPALAILFWYLAFPVVRTNYQNMRAVSPAAQHHVVDPFARVARHHAQGPRHLAFNVAHHSPAQHPHVHAPALVHPCAGCPEIPLSLYQATELHAGVDPTRNAAARHQANPAKR